MKKLIKKFLGGSDQAATNKPSVKKPIKVLTAFDVAEKLGADRRKLEQSFVGLGWTEKSSRGIIATPDGISNGAQTKYHDMSKNNYVVWEESILHNETLKEFLKNGKS